MQAPAVATGANPAVLSAVLAFPTMRGLPLLAPCPRRWSDLPRGADARRFCGACGQYVHDVSAMSLEETRALLTSDPAACVRYVCDEEGFVEFRPQLQTTLPRVKGGALRRTIPALGAMLMAGCATPEPAPPRPPLNAPAPSTSERPPRDATQQPPDASTAVVDAESPRREWMGK
jgi:hypothetical protein